MDMKSLEGTSNGKLGGVTNVMNTLREIRDEDSANKGNLSKATFSAGDNSSTPFLVSREEEEDLLLQLRTEATNAGNLLVAKADPFFLLACIRVRKGAIDRALALATNYFRWRIDVRYHEETTHNLSPSILTALSRGLFAVAGNVSRDGERPVLTVRYKFFDPRRFSALDTARAFGTIIEYMLRTYPRSQTHGIVVVEDAAGFSLSNLDTRLIRFLVRAFTQVLPVRIAGLFVTNPNWIVKAMFGFFSGFMSKKLQTRIRVIDRGDSDAFAQFFDANQVPTFLELGGTLEWTQTQQDQFVDDIKQSCSTWPPASTHPGAQ